MKNKNKKLIIFDLDGTLYKFYNGSFIGSGLQKIVLKNAKQFIMNKLNKNYQEAQNILNWIIKEYGEDISIALEEKYGILRKEYFDYVWDINAKDIIYNNLNIRNILKKIKDKYQFLLVSDGAYVWIKNALKELGIEDFFKNNILSGDGAERKSLLNRFNKIPEQYGFAPENIVVVGDQEKTDIIPANKLGFKTIFISEKYKSTVADVTIYSLNKIDKVLEQFFSQ